MNDIVVEPCNRGLFGSVKELFRKKNKSVIVVTCTIPKPTMDYQIFRCHLDDFELHRQRYDARYAKLMGRFQKSKKNICNR